MTEQLGDNYPWD